MRLIKITAIGFSIANTENISIKNLHGFREVGLFKENQFKTAECHNVQWNEINKSGAELKGGVYFNHVSSGNETAMKQLNLIN